MDAAPLESGLLARFGSKDRASIFGLKKTRTVWFGKDRKNDYNVGPGRKSHVNMLALQTELPEQS